MTDWPPEYDAVGPLNPGVPHWTRDQVLQAGRVLANRIFADRSFAENYLGTVKEYYADRGEHSAEYLALIETAIHDAHLTFTTQGCNSNDFANCHRAAWLQLANAFALLVDKCPHVDTAGTSDWGNPPMVEAPTPHRGISRGDDGLVQARNAGDDRAAATWWFYNVHNIPNSTGFFNISTEDIAAAPVNR
ncbi:MAG TPA: hypothetical protein VGU66_16075 [Candidatus Elarobacter sp.]|nr:hypothetical protein [Candidatus Elarobacter sp.]